MAKSILKLGYWLATFALTCVLSSQAVKADEIRASLLMIEQVTAQDYQIRFNVPAKDNRQRLALNVIFDSSVEITVPAQGHFLDGAYVSEWQIRHANALKGTLLHIDGLNKTPTDVLVRIERLDGTSAMMRLTPDSPTIELAVDSSWGSVVQSYLVLGVEHILIGADHLLFVLALLLLISNRMTLVTTITSFTIAHSITLVLSTLQIIVLPIPPIEACIALSIVFVCSEILAVQRGKKSLSKERPWLVAFCFGLLHGLGFAAVLGEIGLPQDALMTALIVFNIGVELGQLLFIAAVLVLMYCFKRVMPTTSPWMIRVPVYFIGSVSSFWLIERVAGFWAA